LQTFTENRLLLNWVTGRNLFTATFSVFCAGGLRFLAELCSFFRILGQTTGKKRKNKKLEIFVNLLFIKVYENTVFLIPDELANETLSFQGEQYFS
jgi:hypothetical protein